MVVAALVNTSTTPNHRSTQLLPFPFLPRFLPTKRR